MVRVHDTAPLFFLRGVSGSDNGRSDLVVVRLNIEGERREASKDAMAQLKQQAKHADAQYPDVIGIKQQRVGTTDWYRLSPRQDPRPGRVCPRFLCPTAQALLRARFSTSPSIPRRRKTPIRSAQNSIAAANESHPPITLKCERVTLSHRQLLPVKKKLQRAASREGKVARAKPSSLGWQEKIFPQNEGGPGAVLRC